MPHGETWRRNPRAFIVSGDDEHAKGIAVRLIEAVVAVDLGGFVEGVRRQQASRSPGAVTSCSTEDLVANIR